MATPADQRLLELLDKWLKSLDLHLSYVSLDDDSYWKVQPWVEHQRPSRWILDLARQKTVALQAQVEARIAQGDAQYADSLELMIFLANLVGSEHIERFIPVAEPQHERPMRPAAPAAAVDDAEGTDATGTREMPTPTDATGTREMPRFTPPAYEPSPAATAQVARTERKPAPEARPAPKTAARGKGKGSPAVTGDARRDQVIADAARLVQWGRKWYELPELIARMADRPPLAEVRRILKENKAAIDEMAGVP